MTEQEKYRINLLLYSEEPGVSRHKRDSIGQSGTPEERELLAEWVRWDKSQKDMAKRDNVLKQIGAAVRVILLFCALWYAVSVVRYMWSHPLF